MNWRDRLLPASFRGVGFWIDQAKTPVGRKGQLHEYPQRDLPFFEDLGQQAKTHDLTAFIIGPDCLEQRDKLLKALELGPWRTGASVAWTPAGQGRRMRHDSHPPRTVGW